MGKMVGSRFPLLDAADAPQRQSQHLLKPVLGMSHHEAPDAPRLWGLCPFARLFLPWPGQMSPLLLVILAMNLGFVCALCCGQRSRHKPCRRFAGITPVRSSGLWDGGLGMGDTSPLASSAPSLDLGLFCFFPGDSQ